MNTLTENILHRELPSNIEAEQVLLGIFLNNNEQIDKVSDFLSGDNFFLPIHKMIYQNIQKHVERNLIASPITLKHVFTQEIILNNTTIKGFDYLVELTILAQSSINTISLAKIIYDSYLRRELINFSKELLEDSYSVNQKTDNASNLIERFEQRLFNIANQGSMDRDFEPISNSLSDAMRQIEIASKNPDHISGVPSGFKDLDKITGGFQNSDLIILAARPSMGKTALAINFAMNAAEVFFKNNNYQNKAVGIFSLEMSSPQIALRILSMKTGISGTALKRGYDNDLFQQDDSREDRQERISDAVQELSNLKVHIDDTPSLTISAIRTRARRLKRQENLGLLIIDYLQLARGVENLESRVAEIGEISKGLKAIAKELDIPVIALSQLSRAVESREDKRPVLSDLRESGNIEQDADIVMFIYREYYYLTQKKVSAFSEEERMKYEQDMDKHKNLASIIIAKHRNGPVGHVDVFFNSNTTVFRTLLESEYINKPL